MSIEFFIYMIGFIGELSTMLAILLIFSVGLLAIHTFISLDADIPVMPTWKKWYTGVCLMGLCILTILPSERTMYMMAGAHFGKEALNSDVAQKVKSLIEGKLDDMIKEQTEKVKEIAK